MACWRGVEFSNEVVGNSYTTRNGSGGGGDDWHNLECSRPLNMTTKLFQEAAALMIPAKRRALTSLTVRFNVVAHRTQLSHIRPNTATRENEAPRRCVRDRREAFFPVCKLTTVGAGCPARVLV